MSWDDERADIIGRIGSTEAEIKVLHATVFKQKDELQRRITDAAGSVRQELADESRRLSAALDSVGADVSQTQREIERNSVRLGFVIAIGAFILTGVLALVIGLLPYMMTGPEGPSDRVAVPFDQRAQLIIDVVRGMDKSNPDLWTTDRLPRADIIERELTARLGYAVRVTEAERNRAAVIAGVMR